MKSLTWVISKKEFIHIFRDSRTLIMVLIFPVFFLVLFGYAVSFDVKHLPLAVLDQDKTAASREFILKFTHGGYFDLVENLDSVSQFGARLDSGKAKVIFNIPSGFSKDLATGKKTKVQVLLDGSDPTIASSATGYISSIAEEFYQQVMIKVLQRRGIKGMGKRPVNLETRIWYNENLRSLNFFIPGLICVILMMMSATLTSLTIVAEKEEGTMEALVVSPVRKNELMLGKILPYVIIALLDVVLVVAVGSLWFHVPIKGSLILLFGSSFIFLLGAMGIGLFISVNARSSQEAIMIALLATLLPTILLSGFVFPIENMPLVLQGISYLIPATYFLVVLRGIFLKGIGLNYLWWDLLLLSVFTLLIILGSARKFKKRIE
ncbi:MAG: ABC transporter permease [Candidatus Margulisbacteria bacterium]|nr:ABC transporter permease [Candidatus Margulisiibacteriota bacterium]